MMFDIAHGIAATLLHSYLTVALSFQNVIKEKNLELQQAAFLIGLSKFVDDKCAPLRTNRTVFYSAIMRTEIEIRETRTDNFKTRVDGVLEKLARDEKASCQLARRDYGPTGTVTPRIFIPR